MARTLRFKSKEAYRKWLAYGHIRAPSGKRAKSKSQTIFRRKKGHSKIFIRGKAHRVKHKR